LRWLARQPPNIERAKQSIDRIISDGKRRADIVRQIRDFSKNSPPGKSDLEINEAILYQVSQNLTRGELSKRVGV
jgi:hypothetical protein